MDLTTSPRPFHILVDRIENPSTFWILSCRFDSSYSSYISPLLTFTPFPTVSHPRVRYKFFTKTFLFYFISYKFSTYPWSLSGLCLTFPHLHLLFHVVLFICPCYVFSFYFPVVTRYLCFKGFHSKDQNSHWNIRHSISSSWDQPRHTFRLYRNITPHETYRSLHLPSWSQTLLGDFFTGHRPSVKLPERRTLSLKRSFRLLYV